MPECLVNEVSHIITVAMQHCWQRQTFVSTCYCALAASYKICFRLKSSQVGYLQLRQCGPNVVITIILSEYVIFNFANVVLM